MVFCGIPVSSITDPNTGQPLSLPRLTVAMAIERLGLQLVTATVTYDVDVDGKTILDEKGNPVELSRSLPVYDIAIPVKTVGFVDAFGTAIPKGKQYFVATKEARNRQPSESHIKDLATRLDRWVLTGESLIKDDSGSGQNEQHRCWAVLWDALTGSNKAPSQGIPIITLDGVSTGAAGAIDSGKQKSATDDLSSNHEVLPFPLTRSDYVSGTELGYGAEQKIARVKILRDLQGVAKRIVLRMIGSNIKASKFTGHDSGGYANEVCSRWHGLDEIVNMAYAYVTMLPMKDEAKKQLRPVKTWEVATAYALFCLRENQPLGKADELSEYPFPTIDVDPLQEFLTDLEDGTLNGKGPLADWCRVRVTSERLKDSDESSFAQIVLAMKAYFAGDLPVDPSFCQGGAKGVTGKDNQSGSKFSAFGGGDRGPIPKKVKSEDWA